jgi:hypothetical protein
MIFVEYISVICCKLIFHINCSVGIVDYYCNISAFLLKKYAIIVESLENYCCNSLYTMIIEIFVVN